VNRAPIFLKFCALVGGVGPENFSKKNYIEVSPILRGGGAKKKIRPQIFRPLGGRGPQKFICLV